MKKFAIAAVAAIVATVSLSNVAEARRRHFDDGFFQDVDVVIIKERRPRCKTTKFVEIGRHGHPRVTIVKKCR
jgi:hypothetical protein